MSRRPHVVIVGEPQDAATVLARLPPAAFVLSVTPAGIALGDGLRRRPDLIIVLLRERPVVLPEWLAAGLSPPWIGWNCHDDGELSVRAYADGARCVLPAHTPGAVLTGVIAAALGGGNGVPVSSAVNGTRRHYARGDRLLLAPDQILHVDAGIIAQRVVQPDGSEVLIGLNGPSRLVLGHPDDSCCLDLVAHDEAIVTVQAWADAVRATSFSAELRARLRQLEAWSAVQARPHLTARIIGLLSLLADQFGRPHAHGVLVDVRLTHNQLAAATGTTRATITRALGQLRKRRLVWTQGRGVTQRFGLREREAHAHAHVPAS